MLRSFRFSLAFETWTKKCIWNSDISVFCCFAFDKSAFCYFEF